jgi:peptidoglycan/LPS O-acetylase OafA/YrhL
MRRIKRLLPALAVMIVVVLAASLLLESPIGPQQTTANTAIGAMLLAANVVILRSSGNYFDPAATTNPLLHVWSLSVEEQFYLGFPALVLVAWLLGRRYNAGVRAATITIAALTGVSFASAIMCTSAAKPVAFVADPASLAFYASPTRAWEFGVGALVALWSHRREQSRRRRARQAATRIAWVGIGLLAATLLVVDDRTLWPGPVALLPVAGTAALMVAGTLGPNHGSLFLSAKPAVWVGDRSYSLYLWHWPLIVFARLQWPGTAAPLLAALVSVIPAWVSYRYVEQPLRTLRRSTAGVLGFGLVWQRPPSQPLPLLVSASSGPPPSRQRRPTGPSGRP